MRLLAAFLKMVRLPNLFFIALTQFLFYYCIIQPALHSVNAEPRLNTFNFILIVFASVFIAAAGYIINDYFDINIDNVNKPEKNVVDNVVSRRWAMLWHFVISGAGVLLSLIVSWRSGLWYIVIANFGAVFLLFGYSAVLKRKLLAGNVLISLLTAWVVLILSFSEIRFFVKIDSGISFAIHKIVRLGFLYGGFAFVISLVREAIKDMEDVPGDAKYGSKTMPILWGMNASKVYVAVWIVVLLAMLVVIQLYALQFIWWPVLYSIALIILPLGYLLYRLNKTYTPKQFHQLSTLCKFIMFTGIFSMIFFYFFF